MKPSLQLKLSQHLALTPQLQQSIRLLQLSTIELEQELEKYLQENPLLEREDDGHEGSHNLPEAGAEAPASEAGTGSDSEHNGEEPGERDSTPEADRGGEGEGEDWFAEGNYPSAPRDDDEDSDFQEVQAATTSLRDHLTWQLGLMQLSDRDRSLVRFLIEALDEDGYLTQPLEELLESLPEELEIELDDLQIALKHLQHLDPTGVGARSPQDLLPVGKGGGA